LRRYNLDVDLDDTAEYADADCFDGAEADDAAVLGAQAAELEDAACVAAAWPSWSAALEALEAGACTRPLLSSTRAVSDSQRTP
jgi:hypothetical protein